MAVKQVDPELNSSPPNTAGVPQSFAAENFAPDQEPFNDEDLRVIDDVERALRDAVALKNWWQNTDTEGGYEESFELSRTQNRPDTSFGFFGETEVGGKPMPIMGNVQEMFYDRPKTPTPPADEAPKKSKKTVSAADLSLSNYPLWMRQQVREFVLRYFMRASDFSQPESYPGQVQSAPPKYLQPLSWCPQSQADQAGFGFSQMYYKRKDTGEIGKFPEEQRYAITDLRELGTTYEWIVAKVKIFDFKFSVAPMGQDGPQIVMPLSEASYVVLSRDFITDQDDPGNGDLGCYGLGYAFVRDPNTSLLAYGPGQFEAAFQVINFHVHGDGDVHVRMAFVANRPTKVVNISLDPANWGLRMADMATAGAGSQLLDPMKKMIDRLPKPGGVDFVSSYISFINAVSGGAAGRDLCITKQQLERDFLLQHFTQHYNTIAGSLVTWRQIPDWLDQKALPDWVVQGQSTAT